MSAKCCTNTGPNGQNGTNINLWTTFGNISEKKSEFILLGLVSCCFKQCLRQLLFAFFNYCLLFHTGFYTAWLLPVAMLGLIIFIMGIATMNTNTPA